MRIAILGFDVEGRSSFDYLKRRGHEIEIRDQNPDIEVPAGVPVVLGPAYLDGLDRFDMIVRTAGLPPHKILDKNPGLEAKITSNVNEFFKASPTQKIIGVTGTKGKGTTSTLIYKMLEAAGKTAYLGGNIGLPPLDFIDKLTADDWVVLELSSFQLSDLRHSPSLAVCLTVFPEHLDWHPDLDRYFHAKSQLFAHQTGSDTAIYFGPNEISRQIASTGTGKLIPYFEPPGCEVKDGAITVRGQVICKVHELKLLGAHNWQNVCAAVTTTWQITQDSEAIRAVLTSFSGLEHRLEFVTEIEGVRYYDDSFGTTPETAIVAMEAFEKPEIVILGGSDKGISFDGLAEFITNRDNIKKVIVIGRMGPVIANLLRQNGYQDVVAGAQTMDGIVDQARQLAEPGDVVLLSTACASFDMFKNYKDRGRQFKTAVQALA